MLLLFLLSDPQYPSTSGVPCICCLNARPQGKILAPNYFSFECFLLCICTMYCFSCFEMIKNFSDNLSRVGQRGAGLPATIARSEHEISEIIDGLSEQEVRYCSKLLFAQADNLTLYNIYLINWHGRLFTDGIVAAEAWDRNARMVLLLLLWFHTSVIASTCPIMIFMLLLGFGIRQWPRYSR